MFSACESKKFQLLSSVLKQLLTKFNPLLFHSSAGSHANYCNILGDGGCIVGHFVWGFVFCFLGVLY